MLKIASPVSESPYRAWEPSGIRAAERKAGLPASAHVDLGQRPAAIMLARKSRREDTSVPIQRVEPCGDPEHRSKPLGQNIANAFDGLLQFLDIQPALRLGDAGECRIV